MDLFTLPNSSISDALLMEQSVGQPSSSVHSVEQTPTRRHDPATPIHPAYNLSSPLEDKVCRCARHETIALEKTGAVLDFFQSNDFDW
jgi:hypothetical protein